MRPCIVFIDDRRGWTATRCRPGGGHDEREQTLNQPLVEMDGFSTNEGIIVMAATNRPDILDPALLRPGRFDRHITIDRPDVKGRQAILRFISATNRSTRMSTWRYWPRERLITGADWPIW